MDYAHLYEQARFMMQKGKGILAADESVSTMNERLAAVLVDETAEMRRVYRQVLFTAPGIEKYLSGVIFFDASLRSATDEGVPFPDVLASRGIMPGIKVDKGTVDIEEFPGEKVSQGLDDLDERMWEYANLGAYFAKWRAVVPISPTHPSEAVMAMNAMMLARYASICQREGIVPMVEPEVLMHGTHDVNRSEEVTTRALQILFAALREYRVDLKAVVLKTSMVLAGDGAKLQTPPDEVADATLRALRMSVPYDIPGIVFLSGGQTPVRATENLQAVISRGAQPWPITFSYSRAIEEPVLATWKGKEENVKKAQSVLLHRLKMNSLAAQGKYESKMEKELG
jgi:fructose-bisphosphate aldolase, class I